MDDTRAPLQSNHHRASRCRLGNSRKTASTWSALGGFSSSSTARGRRTCLSRAGFGLIRAWSRIIAIVCKVFLIVPRAYSASAMAWTNSATWPESIRWTGRLPIENNRWAGRADALRRTPATVRFVSAEPLLGPLDQLSLDGLDWLIVGGESGKGHRPVEAAWVRDLRDRCRTAGVPLFFKQWGGRTPKAGGRSLDGDVWSEMPAITEQALRLFPD
jgi:Protein of unknown function (DUF5131)